MRSLNRSASEALQALGPRPTPSPTSTGFGLLGHGWEMASGRGCASPSRPPRSRRTPVRSPPPWPGTRTGGDPRNRSTSGGGCRVAASVDASLEAICFDPQTSGGLLAAVDPGAVGRAQAAGFTVVGTVEAGPAAVALT
jgi:selenide,water dikinase